MQFGRLLAGWHPALVHFPIVLLLAGLAADAVALARRRPDARLTQAGLVLTLVGTAFMLLAFLCGILAENFAARSGAPLGPIEAHELFATITAWLFIALAAARLLLGGAPPRRALAPYVALAAVGAALLVVTAYRGGVLVYEYGTNVSGAAPLRSATDEDLAAIALRLGEAGRIYSNSMHHIFGWGVLALACAVAVERLRPERLGGLRALVPFLFLAGGVYLAIFSDDDSWPLASIRPVTDREVLLHKVIAAILVAIGAAGLAWARRARGAERRPWARQNELIAICALAGGGLVLTHVHTSAPYGETAVGVYLNHAAMGLLALATGVAVLLERRTRGRRGALLVLPILILGESILLIGYNEDLPWFLGYGAIVTTPAHGGTVAQAPGGRGELVFGREDGRLDVFFSDARGAAPLALPARPLEGALAAGREAVALGLEPVAGDPGHFQAAAPWLRRVPLFSLSVGLPGGRVEFDPITTAPVLPPLTGAARVYACPMCPDVVAAAPGRCPVCGMGLVEAPRARIRRRPPPPEGRFAVELRAAPEPPVAGAPARLAFVVRERASGAPVARFRIVHEKQMHLFVAKDDLSWFEHVHPDVQEDGSFRLDETFPEGGRYLLFADVAPLDGRPLIERFELAVAGPERPAAPLVETAGLAHEFDGHVVGLRLSPAAPRAGREAELTFTVSKDGRPVDDLGLFLGAAGHCVILSEDGRECIHTHPLPLTAEPPPPAGPEVTFHAYFPRAGRYKAWAQFLHEGRVITAAFVFRVR
jgi:uncharacterized membrane protein